MEKKGIQVWKNHINNWVTDPEGVAIAFDILAGEHDAFIMSRPLTLTDFDIWNMIKQCLPDLNNELPFLDAGAGNGIWSIRLAKQGFKVVSVDISTEMLRVAKSNIDEACVKDLVTLVQADVHNLHSPIHFAQARISEH